MVRYREGMMWRFLLLLIPLIAVLMFKLLTFRIVDDQFVISTNSRSPEDVILDYETAVGEMKLISQIQSWNVSNPHDVIPLDSRYVDGKMSHCLNLAREYDALPIKNIPPSLDPRPCFPDIRQFFK